MKARAGRVLAYIVVAVVAATAIASASPGSRQHGHSGAMPRLSKADAQQLRRLASRRRAQLSTPTARRARRRSRTLYRDASHAEALEIARQHFRDVIDEPVYHGLRLGPGERVASYLGDNVAVIDLPGTVERGVAKSTLPLLTSDTTGQKVPVDLRLERHGHRLKPKAPIAATSIADSADGGFTLDAVGVGIRPDVAPGAETALVGDKLFFANIATDTDLLTLPVPTGVETFNVLRSAASPEDLHVSLDLPPGVDARLVPGPDGLPSGAQIVRNGQVLVDIPPAVGQDADGVKVPVSYRIESNRLTVHVSHRAGTFRYPLLVDPDYVQNGTIGGTGFASWHNVRNNAAYDFYIGNTTYKNFGVTRYGLTIQVAGTVNQGNFGNWYWTAPANSYIYRADWEYVTYEWLYEVINEGISRNGVWEPTNSPHRVISSNVNHEYFNLCFGPPCTQVPDGAREGLRDGNSMIFGMEDPYGTLTFSTTSPLKATMEGADVFLNDQHSPVIDSFSQSAGTAWHDQDISGVNVTYSSHDDGLGLWQHTLDGPGTNDFSYPLCNTGKINEVPPCPLSQTGKSLSYPVGVLPEGVSTIDFYATDIVNHPSLHRSFQAKIDRTTPSTPTVSGDLVAASRVGRASYGLNVSGSDAVSGVASVGYTISASGSSQILSQGTVTNPNCDAEGNCPKTFAADFNVDTSNLADGTYTLTSAVKDSVGDPGSTDPRHRTTASISITIDHNVLTAEQALAQIRATRPDVVAASTAVDLEGETLRPTFAGAAVDGRFTAAGSVVDANVADRYADGYVVGADEAAVSVGPSAVPDYATRALVASGDAAVYANSRYATDAVVRPTGNGIETFLHLRSAEAPEASSWRIALRPGQSLRMLPDGGVAVMDPSPPVSSVTTRPDPAAYPNDYLGIPDGSDDPPAADTTDQPPGTTDEPVTTDSTVVSDTSPPDLPVVQLGQSTAANDTGGQMTRETTAAATAQASYPSETVEAVFLPPTARGANGIPVPASFSASGDTLTLTVLHHGPGVTYPVMVDPEASAAGDDGGRGVDAEAARNNTFRMLTWNIRADGGPGHQPSDVPYGNLAGLIKTQRPAIILLQEVCAPNNLEKLHKQLKIRHYNWKDAFWVAEHGHEGDNGAHLCKDGDKMGNAILSRVSHMSEQRWRRFAHASPSDFQRVVLASTVPVAGKAVRAITLHLDAHSGSRRASQVDWVSKFADGQASNVNSHVVVAGDWNFNPFNSAMSRMNDHGFTFVSEGCGTTLVGDNKCYDHFWRYTTTVAGMGADIITGMNTNDSDHYPVKAHLGYK